MNETEQKIHELKLLGLKRQKSCYVGHHSIADFHNGKYESDFVSPYTKSAGNVNSPIIILLQDWSAYDRLNGTFNKDAAEFGHTRSLPTNRNLKALLLDTFNLQLNEVFATNVFPFIKPGGMSSKIPSADIFRAYKEFCYPQIEIIKPKLVVCCGKESYLATLNHLGRPTDDLAPVCNHFYKQGVLFYHQRHTGATATNVSGGIEVAKVNWKKMKYDYDQFLNALPRP